MQSPQIVTQQFFIRFVFVRRKNAKYKNFLLALFTHPLMQKQKIVYKKQKIMVENLRENKL